MLLMSFSFFPVGNRNGEIELWDVCSEVKMFWNAFTIWRREAISTLLLVYILTAFIDVVAFVSIDFFCDPILTNGYSSIFRTILTKIPVS